MIKLAICGNTKDSSFQLLTVTLSENGIISPADLKDLKLPEGIEFRKGVVIYGKGPLWLYAFLSHELHIAKWVATFDPRIGAVIVQSHDKDSPQVGDVIDSDEILNLLNSNSCP